MKSRQVSPCLSAVLVLVSSQLAHAQLTWDANGTGSGQANGAGDWLGANLWWNGSANQNWASGSNAILGGAGGAGGAVTLPSAVAVGSITFNTFTGTYTLGSTGFTLTVNSGINKTSNAAAVSLASGPIALGAAQTWTNNSSGAFNITSPVNNNGHLLTFDGNGTTNFGTAVTGVISGAGGLTYNGTGRLFLAAGSTPVHTYGGTTTLNGGVTMVGAYEVSPGVAAINLGPGNLVLNGGVMETYWQNAFTRSLGTGNGQVQIPGGVSGFGNNNGGSNVILNNSAGFEVVWGAANEAGNALATGFFNPSTLALQTQFSQNAHTLNFQNRIDLNGSTRTIQTNAGSSLTSTATISGVIRNTAITTAGIVKTGSGPLILTAANTYDGGTTINSGSVRFNSTAAMPPVGNVAVNTGTTLTIETGASGDWTAGTSGVGTLGGLLAGLGGAGTSTVSFTGDVTLGLEMTGNLTYAGDIPDLGTTLGVTKTGGSSLTLTGNNAYTGRTRVNAGTLSFNSIANVGGGNSALGAPATAANGTINVGTGGTAAVITYTGSGHSTDRVINLSGSTGGATIESSGSGSLTLTSAITAAAGAKTLVLGGTNTGNNSLAATTLPALAEILTIQKNGAGFWRINSFSSPRNAWTVTAGTWLAAGGITTGDQNFTVSGGTLAGVGPITLQSDRSLTVQSAGSLSPGNSGVGTMAVTGILNISAMAGGTGKLNFEVAAPNASDRIAVTGTAEIGNGQLGLNDFVFTNLGGMTANTYTLISTTGGITGTLDPANRLGTIGTVSGALQINGNNLEFTLDSDLDGLPDSYELANTSPASATGLDPNGDALLDNDGLTNLQEYLAGTNPNNPDTDADGSRDGVETNTGTWVSATNTGTNPLVFDTDGDTIRDGYETNTGTYASTTNTGTNPLVADTDLDGLRDNVETNTGTYVSTTDTGTSPHNANTDGDNAGDWYEVVIIDKNPALGSPPNSPNTAAIKPNIPYPLPAYDGSPGVTNKPVKVYILSGQSNMLGYGTVSGNGVGRLNTMVNSENKYPHLRAAGGGWVERNDVHVHSFVDVTTTPPGIDKKKLRPDWQTAESNRFGPELGFGTIMGWHHDEPVLLVKPAIGNRALGWDYLPPGTPDFQPSPPDGFVYAGFGRSGPGVNGNGQAQALFNEAWSVGNGPGLIGWYAGKQFDDYFRDEEDMEPRAWTTGITYPSGITVRFNGLPYTSIAPHTSSAANQPGVGAEWTAYNRTNVVDVLDNFATQYPAAQYPGWAANGFEIAGYVWWQGNRDQNSTVNANRYKENMERFISQIRLYYENRYNNDTVGGSQNTLTKTVVDAPFVLATLDAGDWSMSGNALTIANAQHAVDASTVNVKTVEARGFARTTGPNPNDGTHYFHNAETFLLTGDALGRAMLSLLAETNVNTYASWIASYPSVPANLAGFNQDADGDGVDNGVENFFGTNPGVGSAGLSAGIRTATTFTFTHPQNATPASGVAGTYRWSKDLITFRNGGQTDGDNTTVSFSAVTNAGITTVTATITGTPTAKLFVDVRATQN